MTDPTYQLGQVVVQRIGRGEDAVDTEVEIKHVKGRTVITDEGLAYDAFTGMGVPRSEQYRSIRALAYKDTGRKAENLLGGTEGKKR